MDRRILMPPLMIVLLLALLSFQCHALDSKDILPPEQAFTLSATKTTFDRVELTWTIAKGYHLYQDKFKLLSQNDAIQIITTELPVGLTEYDAVFGDVVVYRDTVTVGLPLNNPTKQSPLKLSVRYQGCADVGVCYPPQKTVLELALQDELPVTVPTPASTPASAVTGLKALMASPFQNDLLPPEQAFQFLATVKDAAHLEVSWIAADGYYLYKDKLGLSLNPDTQMQLGAYTLPIGEQHNDPEAGQVTIYRHTVSLAVPLQRTSTAAETVQLTARFQGCADRGVCYPPQQSTVSLALPAMVADSARPVAALSEQDQLVTALQHDGFGLTLMSFLGFGVLLAFTPCIFPMIPILSGIIVGHGHAVSARKGFMLSLSYVAAHALMYTAFGVLAALFGSNLQATFQQPWIVACFSAVFVLLALSMFGLFNLEMPKALQAMAHQSSDKHRDGSYWGAAMMGALSSLIVGPCVAAPLAAALIYIGQTGDVLLGGGALFAMGLGMGMPLLVVGASAGRLLPKAGEWLNATKAVFGVILLAVAAWMLSRVVPPAVTQLLVALLLIIPAVYLHALEPLPLAASGWRKLWKGLGVVMLIVGVLQLIGLSAGSHNPLQPIRGLMAAGSVQATAAGLGFTRIASVAELDAQLAAATAQGKTVMLDFYADWCVSCKEMEAFTFSDARVKQRLANTVLLQADVTANTANDKQLLQRFNLFGPPGIVFFERDGQEDRANRVIGYQDAATFLNTLDRFFDL